MTFFNLIILLSVFVGFASFAIVGCKDLCIMEIICRSDLPGTILAMLYPEN